MQALASHATEPVDVVDGVLAASCALVAVAAKSLAAAEEEVTLPQYRALVVLTMRGPQRMSELADLLEVNQSTVTRMCDRLDRKGLIARERPDHNRRIVIVTIAPAGQQLVAAVMRRRRSLIRSILRKMTRGAQHDLVAALAAFAEAAGEAPEQAWSLGWGLD